MNDMVHHACDNSCMVGAFDLVGPDFPQSILGAGERVGIDFLALEPDA